MDPPQPPRPLQWYRDFEPTDISDPDVTIRPEILCKACLRVVPWLQDNRGVEESQRQTLTHSTSGQALEKACKDGCHLCTLLWHCLVEKTSRDFSSLEKRLKARDNRADQVRGGSEVTLILGLPKYSWSPRDTSFSIKTCIKLDDGNELNGEPLPLQLGTPSQKPRITHAGFSYLVALSTKGISTLTCSESSLAQAKTWLEECTQTHPICQSQLPHVLPRRLLAVSHRPNGIHLRLTRSDELQDPTMLKWVCLSYCWGGSFTSKLTRSTTTSLELGIMADQLPKTIQDAASVVLALGLEFLWVDALCILQDSAEDWLHEAKSMGDIYRGSFLTLAALGAADSSGGLFASRDPLMYSKCRVSLENSEVATVYPAWSNYMPFELSRTYSWPLHTRGWVVQERILSRRTLRFGSTLSWECRQSAVSEFDPSERGMWDFGNELPLCTSFYQRVIDPQQPHDEPPRPEDKQTKDVRELWDSIVSEFSRADLTVLLDRQAAILGLVSAIALRTGWKNLAGFWWPLTIRDLAWTVSAGITERRRTGLSPSWSWLSITGGVDLARVSASEFSVAEIEGVDDEDRTVSVRLSCIRLRLGPLRDGSHEAPEGWPSFDFFVWEDLLDSLPDEVYVLPLVLTTGSEYSEVEGILVTPSRACLGAHERVGSFTHEMWDDAARAKMAPIFEILHDVSRRETVILV